MQRTKKLEENKIKTREQNKGRKIKTLLSSPIHLAHHRSTVEPILLCCCTHIATLSLCCRSTVAPLSHRYRSAVATPLLLRCRAGVTPLLHRYCSTVAPLLLLLLSIRSHTAIAPVPNHCRYTTVAPWSRCCYTDFTPVSLHCGSAAVAPAVATQSHHYRTVVEPLSNCNRSSPERV